MNTTLREPALSPAEGSVRLAHLGFLLLEPRPSSGHDAQLVVALHDRPTLTHYDPERIRFWETGHDRRGHPFELTRSTTMPLEASYSWGKITLVDRLAVENEFVSVGGTVTADEVMPGRTVAIFRSPGPILRLGGHSQSVDTGATELGAFFARMMVPIDFVAGAEEAISTASPLDRYAAFVAFKDARFARHPAMRYDEAGQATRVADEAMRLRRTQPEAWARGRRLLEVIGLRT